MLKKEYFRNCIMIALVLTAMLLLGNAAPVSAEGDTDTDIASGTYDGVPWRITDDDELLIGDGEEHAFTNKTRNESSWPWSEYPTCSRIKEVTVLGTVHGRGSLRGMFNEFQNCVSIDISNLDTSETTDMGLMFSSCYQLKELDVSGFATGNVTNMRYMFCQCKSLTNVDVSRFDTSNVTDMWAMFSNCQSLTSLDVSGFETGKVTNMGGMFVSCKALASIDTSGFDTSNVADMSEMFSTCSSLTNVDVSGFDTSKVTDMYRMFGGCSSLTSIDLSGFDTGNVTNTNGMFEGCSSLISIDLSGFDWGNAEYIANMFQGCKSLTSVDISGLDAGKAANIPLLFSGCESLTNVDMSGFNAGNITDLSSMFSGCKSLTSVNLSGVNTSGVQHIEWMFKGCKSLTNIDLSEMDTSSVTNMRGMFYGCESLIKIDLSETDTSNVTNMSSMFEGCLSLEDIDLTGLDTSKVTDMSFMFIGCKSLTNIDLSGMDTSKVIFMYRMFENCESLTIINLDSLQASDNCMMDSMFKDCSSLTTILQPDSLKRLDYGMFDGCYGLKEVEISDLNSWCSIKFYSEMSNPLNASSDAVLTLNGGTGSKVNLNEGITQIPDRTFNGWKYLKEITLPKSLTRIGANAFAGTDKLSTVNVDSLEQWLNLEFATETSSPLAGGKAELRIRSGSGFDSLSKVAIDKTVGNIPAYAFSGCKSLRSIVIPDSVTTIGTGAFASCGTLSEIVLPDSISVLPEELFRDCTDLQKILIPESVTSIDRTAFQGCSKDLVLYGTPGSAAESFASLQGIRFLDYSEYDAMLAGTISDDIRWILTGGSQLTIEGTGEDVTLGTSALENIKDKVTNVKIKGISRIEEGAFSSFTDLERVTIDINTFVDSIDPAAFAGCSDVQICCYHNNYDLIEQMVASGDLPGFTVKKLSGSRAGNVTWTFNENTGTLLLSSGSQDFGETFTESPFRDLDIRRVEFSDSFACKALPANLFAGCASLKEVRLAAQTTEIGEAAFKDCTNLRRVTWHEGITEIGERAFENCTNLQQVIFADSILVNEKDQEMEEVSIEIPAGVRVIPTRAFRNCTSIREVNWYEDIKDETAGGNTGASSGGSGGSIGASAGEEIGGSIGESAFENCSALAAIGIPDHVKSIGAAAFKGCDALVQDDEILYFSENLKELGAQAFNGCYKIRSIIFEADLSSIGEDALDGDNDFTVEAPENAANIKAYCTNAGLHFITTEGIGDAQMQQDAYVRLAQQSVTVKAGKSKKIAYSTNGKVRRIRASGTMGKVSVAKSGRKVKFTGKSAGSRLHVGLRFTMKGAGDKTRNVTVTVKKASSGLDGLEGAEQIIRSDMTAVTFSSDAAASKKIRITRASDTADDAENETVEAANEEEKMLSEEKALSVLKLSCQASKNGIVKYTIKDNGILQIKPLKAGKTTLTVYAEADDVFEASEPIKITVTVKARPAKVTASVKKLSKKKAKVSWKKVSGVKNYQIQVSTSKSFKKKKTYTVKSSITKKTVKITKGKKNYIRVRYKLASGKTSKWSKTLAVKK